MEIGSNGNEIIVDGELYCDTSEFNENNFEKLKEIVEMLLDKINILEDIILEKNEDIEDLVAHFRMMEDNI